MREAAVMSATDCGATEALTGGAVVFPSAHDFQAQVRRGLPAGLGQEEEARRANLLMMLAGWAVVCSVTVDVQAHSACHSGEKISVSTSQQVSLPGRLVSAMREALREARVGLPAAKLFIMSCVVSSTKKEW